MEAEKTLLSVIPVGISLLWIITSGTYRVYMSLINTIDVMISLVNLVLFIMIVRSVDGMNNNIIIKIHLPHPCTGRLVGSLM